MLDSWIKFRIKSARLLFFSLALAGLEIFSAALAWAELESPKALPVPVVPPAINKDDCEFSLLPPVLTDESHRGLVSYARALNDLILTSVALPIRQSPEIRSKRGRRWLPTGNRLVRQDEWNYTNRYAAWILRHRQETLFFLPAYEGHSIPGFDGVIFDQLTLNPIVNYTQKSVHVRENKDFDFLALRTIHRSIELARKFSERQAWLTHLVGNGSGMRDIRNNGQFHAYIKQLQWTKAVTEMLGLDFTRGPQIQTRKTRIVIDVDQRKNRQPLRLDRHVDAPFRRQIKEILQQNSNLIESIIFVDDSSVEEVWL